jgi:hypothetical protein
MDLNIDCKGCCWMSKKNLIVWKCDQTQCPVNQFFFEPSTTIVEECFT